MADCGAKQAAVVENVKDDASGEMVSIAQGSYDDLGEFIDRRYRLQFGVLYYGDKSYGDMELSAVEAAMAAEEAARLIEVPGDVDVVGKGGKNGDKGTSKGASGKPCFRCRGFNHAFNNCTTPKSSTAIYKCCNRSRDGALRTGLH